MAGIFSRQNFDDGDGYIIIDDGERSFWWTRTGQIVRWSLFFGLFFLFIAFMVGGYMHAKRRINKGLPPLAYHRWLLSRQQRARYDPSYQNPSAYYRPYSEGQYGMHPMPPPMYDPNQPPPPSYQPPPGATKVDPSQWRSEPTRRPVQTGEPSPAYEAPPGPPPAAVQANHTGGSAVSNNPYRM